jgi:hypothetical protein
MAQHKLSPSASLKEFNGDLCILYEALRRPGENQSFGRNNLQVDAVWLVFLPLVIKHFDGIFAPGTKIHGRLGLAGVHSIKPPGHLLRTRQYYIRLATQNYFVIFDRNANKIGHLPPNLAREVAEFYLRSKGVIEDFKLLRYRTPDQCEFASAIAVLEELTSLLGELVERAEILVPRLQAEAERP